MPSQFASCLGVASRLGWVLWANQEFRKWQNLGIIPDCHCVGLGAIYWIWIWENRIARVSVKLLDQNQRVTTYAKALSIILTLCPAAWGSSPKCKCEKFISSFVLLAKCKAEITWSTFCGNFRLSLGPVLSLPVTTAAMRSGKKGFRSFRVFKF